jgi:hypothetical protein
MATIKPELHNIDAVLSYYDEYDAPAYKIFAGHKPEDHNCRYQYIGEDKNIGKEKLFEGLQGLISNPDNTNTYSIHLYNIKTKGKLEPTNSITFQLNKPASYQHFPIHYQPQNNGSNDLILAKLNAIEQRINLIENDDDDDDNDDEQPNNELGTLGTLINNPQVQTMLIQGIMNIFNTKSPQTVAVAGIPETEDEKIKVALEVLIKNVPNLGDKLLKLADMSVNESTKFKMLLTFL